MISNTLTPADAITAIQQATADPLNIRYCYAESKRMKRVMTGLCLKLPVEEGK